MQNKCMFYISLSFRFSATHSDPHGTSARCAAPVALPCLSLACFLFSQAGLVQVGTPAEETLTYPRQKETQTSNPCGGPNPLASTDGEYSNVTSVCGSINLWRSCFRIGYQSQQGCCFKLILLSYGKAKMSL